LHEFVCCTNFVIIMIIIMIVIMIMIMIHAHVTIAFAEHVWAATAKTYLFIQ